MAAPCFSRIAKRGVLFLRGIQTILPVVFIMFTGWLLRKRGHLDGAGVKQLNNVLFWLVMPAILLRAGLKIQSSDLSDLRFLGVLYGVFSLTLFLSYLWAKMAGFPPARGAVSVLAAIRSNVVFIGLPLVTVLLGDPGVKVLSIYISLGMIFYNTVPVACSQMVIEGYFSFDTIKKSLGKAVRTPLIIAGATGIVISLSGGVCLIPEWLMRGLALIAQAGSGLALVVIGASLKLDGIIPTLKRSLGDLAIKLFLFPLIMALAFHFFPTSNSLLSKVAILSASLSPAFNTFILACGMDMDSSYAADYVATATVIGLFSTAMWIEFLF